MKVVKFGGSSLANGDAFEQAIAIIKDDSARQIVVTSAPGKRFKNDIKVTDLLINYANAVINHADYSAIQNEIFSRYEEIGAHFGVQRDQLSVIHQIIVELPNGDYPDDNFLMAAFKAHGERLNARLMALVLQKLGINARFVDPKEAGLIVDGEPNNAIVDPQTYNNLAAFDYSADEKLIFPGFFGFTIDGNIATFSRGGSDITGAILARGFHADLYENFTDVDAIFSANPSIVNDPQPIKRMTYREMRELSYAGFSVFHDEALIPAIEGNIIVNVKNTHAPEKPGTLIVPDQGFHPEQIVTGIAGGKHYAALYLHKYLLNREAGFTLKILEILNKYGLPYEHMPSGIDDITIIFDRKLISDDLVQKLCDEVRATVNPDSLEWIDDYAVIMVVGEGMFNRVGVAAGIFTELAEHNIRISMINQGASRISIMIGTYKKDADNAIRAIYQHFFPEK
ncbi:aspartate kinase [Limosilactobacillus coleohominis 101-4-CHN]|uniref:Aspartokinase n=1 Tax=Limosilactobacillus coleohominis 101-4-CHN TaxID=575594 RepID=C7XU11_9LACO|nr:aspartate kinase [Limosilactobacillus coleohominis]EEU30772.1 aspartate kinase [Limosilactobacillus coleohominis 101-4-CHN]